MGGEGPATAGSGPRDVSGAVAELPLRGGLLVAALDTDDGGALVRVVTPGGDHVHLHGPEVAGQLEVDVACHGLGLGRIRSSGSVGGELRLAGSFGWLSMPIVTRVDLLDRWRGVLDPGGDDPLEAATRRVLERPEVTVHIARRDGEGPEDHVLLAAAGPDAVSVAAGGGGDDDAVLFTSQDLTLRMAEAAGLLGHPTAPADQLPTPERSTTRSVLVVVSRHLGDGTVSGGYLRWSDVGPRGSVWVLEQADDGAAVVGEVRSVASVVAELLRYTFPDDGEPPAAG